ncbi:hypothetical protein V6N13_001154 [Hibiscus sabdariffa]
MASNSFLNYHQDLDFTNEEQADDESTNVPTNPVAAITTTPNTLVVANNTAPSAVKVPITVVDDESTTVPLTLVAADTTALPTDVFEPQLDATTAPYGITVAPATDPKLASATIPLATTLAISNAQKVAATTGPFGTTMATLSFDSNVGQSLATHGLGMNMVHHVLPNSFIGSEGPIDILATPAETNTDAPLLFDNMGLSVIPTIILPTQLEGGLDNEMVSPSLQRHLCCSFSTNGS